MWSVRHLIRTVTETGGSVSSPDPFCWVTTLNCDRGVNELRDASPTYSPVIDHLPMHDVPSSEKQETTFYQI